MVVVVCVCGVGGGVGRHFVLIKSHSGNKVREVQLESTGNSAFACWIWVYRSAHDILVLIAYAQKFLINEHADVLKLHSL